MITAREFLIKNIGYGSNDVEYQMIEFTKLHLREALISIHNKALQEGLITEAGICYFENAYSLDNIR